MKSKHLIFLASVFTACTFYAPSDPSDTSTVSFQAAFGEPERKIIIDYYKSSPSSNHKKGKKHKAPPGLAKRGGDLPKGLAKREVLPPGLEKRSFPSDLERILPTAPRGTERVIVGNQAVLLDISTHVVLDSIDLSIYIKL